MFKQFTLVLDYLFVVLFAFSKAQFNFLLILPPLFHTLAYLTKSHCYAGHCKPCRKVDSIKVQQQQSPQKKSNDELCNQQKNYLSPFNFSDHYLSLPSGSPSPGPFEPDSDKKKDKQKKVTDKKRQQYHIQKQYQQCKQCGLSKWVRMQHCYYCNVCVHKYDHHCILLGICIGEANQKYYLPFLWAFFITSFIQVKGYYSILSDYLYVDQNGYEHVQWKFIFMNFAIIFFILSILLVGYLSIYHTYLAIHNNTTYEIRKRDEIYYLRGVMQAHPFDKGAWENIKNILLANRNCPMQWEKPSKLRGLTERSNSNLNCSLIESKNIQNFENNPKYDKQNIFFFDEKASRNQY